MKISNKVFKWFSPVLFIFVLCPLLLAQDNINTIGSFEQDLPSYWTKGSEESTLSWATDESMSMGRSLKINKTTTSTAAMWESENMVDLWSDRHFKDVDIKLGAYYKTMGVNTNPANDDEKWYISYSFYREDNSLIGEWKSELDQSVATSDWQADTTDIGELSLPEDSYTTIIRFVGGKDATGTVWADDFIFVGRGGWAGQDWNTQLGVPTGWFYWLPPIGGNDGELTAGYENTVVTDEDAYHGNYSLKFDMLEGTRDGFVGTIRYPLNNAAAPKNSTDISSIESAQVGDVLRISVWIKGANLEPDSVAAVGDQWSVAITPIFHKTIDNNEGFGDYWASDIPLKFPNATSFDWTQFYVDVTVPAPPAGEEAKSLTVRLHPLGRFQGTVWMDALTVEKLDLPEISGIGSFEQDLPSYWTKGSEESTLSWATDESMSMGRSLKINKTTTSTAAMWESENMVDLWSDRHFKDVDIKLGAYYKTMGVNTNPANDDEKWYISYSFYREDNSLIGEWKSELDQSVATSDWQADTTDIGELSLPEDSYTTIIRFVGGKDATGTVWADDFIFVGRGGWAGQDWNTQLGVPTGWFYWLPPIGGNDGELTAGYENTVVTDEDAYHGNYSLKFDMLEGTRDGFVGTIRYPLNNAAAPKNSTDISSIESAQVGDVLRISVWIKGANLEPDSVAAVGDQWSVAITPIFHKTIDNNEGFGDYWASDIPLKFPNATSFDWTQFYVDVTVPAPPAGEEAKSLTVRLHPLGRFQGTVWMDALTVEKLDLPEISGIGSFEQDLPSYWTKGSEESTLSWATDESMSMGRSLKINKTTTSTAAMWESENMVDLWSDRHFKDVDIKLGAYYKTMGVNTNPANDDEKWYISYSFYREDNSLIGEWKSELDQSVATSDWQADTTDIGELSLPEDSYTTIIRFVGGKDATGTVWADDFIFVGRGGWAGQDWNTQLGVPTGWFYWLPPIGGNDGELTAGYENTVVTDEDAYHGNYSLKFDMLEGTRDGFVGTIRYPLNNAAAPKNSTDISSIESAQVGDVLRISVWIKGANLEPDSVAAVGDQWSIAITPIFHKTIDNNEGFGDYWASDIPLKFPNATSFDWTQFYVDVTVPAPPAGEEAKSLTVRLHPLGRFQGTVWMDALEVKVIQRVTGIAGDEVTPDNYALFQNYPNPFNPSTTINYSLPEASYVTVKIYDMLGSEVNTLYSGEQSTGVHSLTWNGENSSGVKVSSGAYLYRIKAGEFSSTMKMILLK